METSGSSQTPVPPASRRQDNLASLQRCLEAFAQPAGFEENGDLAGTAMLQIGRQIDDLRRESSLSSRQVLQLLREIAGQCTGAIDQLERRARQLQGDETMAETRRQMLDRVEGLRKEIYRQLSSLQQSEEQGVPGKMAMALGTLYRREGKFPPICPN